MSEKDTSHDIGITTRSTVGMTATERTENKKLIFQIGVSGFIDPENLDASWEEFKNEVAELERDVQMLRSGGVAESLTKLNAALKEVPPRVWGF